MSENIHKDNPKKKTIQIYLLLLLFVFLRPRNLTDTYFNIRNKRFFRNFAE